MFLLKKIIEIALSSKDDERIQATESIETYACEMKKDLVCENKEKMQQYNKTVQKRFIWLY